MNPFNRYLIPEDESLQAMREREKLARLPLFFKGMLMFMGTVFAVEIVYFSMGINTTRKFCDELRAVSLSADHQRNVSPDAPSPRQLTQLTHQQKKDSPKKSGTIKEAK